MNVINFQKQLIPHQIFSLQDIIKALPDFSYRQIDRWEKKGYIRKIKQGFYALADQQLGTLFLFLTANKIYTPSYVSLENALKFYGLIPEEYFQITSVSTKKTAKFETSIGNFSYRQIDSSLFWGYNLIKINNQKVLMASAEKAILDYLYLHTDLKTVDDFSEMRINADSFHEHVNLKKFRDYLEAFENKSLTKRAQTFLNTIEQ